jgi:hypothetical protein
MITLYLLPLLLLSVIPAYIAQTKGKSFGAWYVYGLFLLPITFVHSLILGRDDRKCPHCAELVKLEATVCKHCGSELEVEVEEAVTVKPRTFTQEEIATQKRIDQKDRIGALVILAAVTGLMIFIVLTQS